MKKISFLLSIIFVSLLLFAGCKNSTETETTEGMGLADLKLEPKYDKIPLLKEIFAAAPATLEKLGTLAALLENPAVVTNQKIIEDFLKMRDVATADMYELIENEFYKYSEEERYEEWDNVEKEFAGVGMRGIYAEGMFVGVAGVEVLKPQIEQFGAEDFKLFMLFNEQLNNSFGGEYPYADLSSQLEMVHFGELLRTKFPDSEYTKAIETDFWQALSCLTDFHYMVDGDDKVCILFELNSDYYPYMSETGSMETFVEKYADSKYTPIIKKILENTSTLIGGDNTEVFLVITQEVNSVEELQKVVFENLENGKDIPHPIVKEIDGKSRNFVVYRFYHDEASANEALEIAKKMAPQAYIMKTTLW